MGTSIGAFEQRLVPMLWPEPLEPCSILNASLLEALES